MATKKINSRDLKIDLRRLYKITGTLNRLKRFSTDVGIFDPKVAEYAARMEYGDTNKDGTITPARSFIRSTTTEKQNQIIEHAGEKVRDVFFARGGKSEPTFYAVEQIFKAIGENLSLAMVDKIWNKIPPPLSKRRLSEKKAKGSPFPEVPLIDTGKLINSITYKVERINPTTKQKQTQ